MGLFTRRPKHDAAAPPTPAPAQDPAPREEPPGSPWAVGLRHEARGEVRAALGAYEAAFDSGVRPQALRAVLRRAEVAERRGAPGAGEDFLAASASPDADVRAQAWRGVASERIGRGDVHGGLAALEAVVATNDPDEMPRALRNIGVVREDHLGDLAGARTAFEAAAAHDHPHHSDGARVNLAQMLDRQGDHATAAALLRRVLGSANATEAARAGVLLGIMHQEQSDLDEALRLWESVAAGPPGEWAARACTNIAGVRFDRGDTAAALPLFRRGTALPDPAEAAVPHVLTGLCEVRLGNPAGARSHLEFAAAHGTPDVRDEALRLLRESGA